ncbi:MAG: GDP-mannose 4,6-dehydratase [Minisyncoccia bacterium]
MGNNVILITGASGFIGRALTTRLLLDPSNIKIILLSRTCNFEHLKDYKQVIPVIGDINNMELLIYVLQSHQVTNVYHLASEAITSEYIKNPRRAYLDTVYGATSLLEAIRISKVPVKKVIINTSYKVYGRAEPPYNEETHFLPGNTYETAKACQDLIAQDYFRTFKVPVIIFRSVNVYGPGDNNNRRLVSKSFSDVYQNKQPTVYSSVKDSLREFVYIEDLIDAMLLLQEKAIPGDIYCIGGQQHSIYEVVQNICEVVGYEGGIQVTETSNIIETKEHELDSSKIEKLGWKKKTSLKEGLKKTNEYYKDILSKL